MSEFITRDFLARHGAALVDQGYTVVPIQQGKKAPGFDGWQKAKATKDQVRQWLEDGFRNAGVGILTKYTCAIDIDCLDEPTALKFEQWCVENVAPTCVRIGKPPKRLLLYRTTEPFRKRRSTVFVDEWGDKQLIEVLGDGQQFVAFHIHPDTGKPYEWIDGKSPLNIRSSDLPELSADQIEALIEAFEEHAKAQGWAIHKAARKNATSGEVDKDNPWVEDTAPVDISIEELRSRLLLVPGSEDYDTWFQVGAALYHQFDGDETGFDLWNEWSETADNYDPDSLERHWKTFDISGKKRAPLTARFILRLSKEAVERTAIELTIKLKDAFTNAKDLAEWEKARQMAREAEIDGLARSSLAAVAKERRDAITGTKTSLGEIKKAISYMPKNVDMPGWAEGWVYDVSDDKFFDTNRKIAATKQGFDAMYDRQAMTKKDILDGKASASLSASSLALNVFQVPVVTARRYMPGRDSIFIEPDGKFANTYPEHEIPPKPEKILPRDKRNIERVKAHVKHLLADETEQRMLLDWLSWVVQNPGKHANYAVLLQGVEGDGKSFFGELMRAVMGVSNVKMLNASTVVGSDFSDWAYGQCLACVEEVRIVGKKNGADKWEAINRIKPFITNHIIEVHPKGKAVFNVLNTTSYLMFSNYQDALPIDDNTRRYLVLFSRWQSREKLAEFLADNPNYYDRLYAALTESAGALRQWLLDHEQAEGFNPLGIAPDTKARKVMIYNSKPDFMQMVWQLISEGDYPEISDDFIDLAVLEDALIGRSVDMPSPKTLNSMLEREGFKSLGRVKLGDGIRHTIFAKDPDRFQHKGFTDTWAVRKYIRELREAAAL